MLKKVLTTVAAAAALVATPVLAQEQSVDRLAAPIEADAEDMARGAALPVALAAIAAIVVAIIMAMDDENQNLPTSP